MNTDDRFIRQLESYLDDYEGATPLPERVREAVRAALPRTKQTGAARGPVRYLSMTLTKVGPIALAAAAGLLAIAAGIYLFGGANVGSSDASTPPAPTTAPSVAPSVAPSAESCTTTTVDAVGDTIDVSWCSAQDTGTVPIRFSMQGPSDWADEFYGDVESLWLRPGGGGAILFAVHPTSFSVDELVDDVRGRDGYVLTNEGTVDVGGTEAVVFDLTLAEGTSSGDAEPLFETPQQPWLLQAGSVHRVWVMDSPTGGTLMVVTGSALADAVGEALTTLTWSE